MADRNTWVVKITTDLGGGSQDYFFSTGPVKGQATLMALLGVPLISFGLKTRFTHNTGAIGTYDASSIRLEDRTFSLRNAGWADVARDTVAIVYLGRASEDFSNYAVYGRVIIDRVEEVGNRYLDIIALDPAAQLERTLHGLVYDNTVPRSEIEGDVVPILLGKAYQFEPISTDPDPGDNLFDINDTNFTEIISIEDRGDAFTFPGDYTLTTTGFNLVAPPSGGNGTITCTASGDRNEAIFTLGPDLLGGIGSFTSWTGIPPNDQPNGWVTTESPPNAVVTEAVAGTCTITHISGLPFPQIADTPPLTVDAQYRMQIDVQALSGTFLFTNAGGTTTYATLTATGNGQTFDFTADETGFRFLQAVGSTRIDNLTIKEKLFTTPLVTVGELIGRVLERRGLTNFVQQDLDDLDTAIGTHELGVWLPRPETAANVIGRLLDSVGGWMYTDRNGNFRFGRLEPPSMSATFTIDDNVITGQPQKVIDFANGLSTVLKSRRNWSPLDESSVADSLTTEERQLLAMNYRITSTAASDPDSYYSHALNNCPIETDLTDDTSGQTLVDYWNGTLYGTRREFWTVPIALSTTNLLMRNLHETVELKSARINLAAGKNFRLFDLKVQSKRTATAILWG